MQRALHVIGGVSIAFLLVASSLGTADAPASGEPAQLAPIAKLNTKLRNRIVLTTAGYRLSLSKDNGALIELVDRRTGTRLLSGQAGCAWGVSYSNLDGFGGCAYGRTGENRFTYRWIPKSSRLVLGYGNGAGGQATASVTLAAARDHLDFRLTLQNDFSRPVAAVLFPADLVGDTPTVRGVYTPTFLPGIRLRPSFFSTPHRDVERYPSRWAFADFLAADVGPSHVALYSVNPAPAPIAPVDIGVYSDDGPSSGCSGQRYCLTHAFQTWVKPDAEWSSPIVRLRVGGSIEQSLTAYRADNGIDAYPSVSQKLGARLDTLARAPLVKADLWKGLPRFSDWGPFLRRLPTPSLLHPVAFQPGGHDEDYPDFLPPDSRWGSIQTFNGALADARSLGDMVMPYLNVSWWDTGGPTVQTLPPPLTPRDIAMQTSGGDAVTEQFGDKDGYIVSPYAPFVRERVAQLFDEWRTEVPADCLFFDQIGARPWRRDFNPAEPTPLAYQDGWLATFGSYRDRCLMSEDGWDRLADAFVGFLGGVLEMQREHNWPDTRWGPGNWEPYPLALWLMHDKVLMYQHDLYPNTFTSDPEVLLFNVAFGMMLSYNWDGETDTLDSPWLGLVARVQQALGPLVAGKALTAFRHLEPSVTLTEFGNYSVVANWSSTSAVDYDGYRIAPLGFLARSDGRVDAGAFGDTWSGVTVPNG